VGERCLAFAWMLWYSTLKATAMILAGVEISVHSTEWMYLFTHTQKKGSLSLRSSHASTSSQVVLLEIFSAGQAAPAASLAPIRFG
jgi:hypothetical protein